MLIKLSYNLSESTPFYRQLPKPHLRQLYDLANGDACNSYYFTSSNHAGTHVDAPRHFNVQGRAITEYELQEFVFEHPAVTDVPVEEGELIQPHMLEKVLTGVPRNADMLLVRTGFGRHRQDERRYMDRGPGFGPDAAEFLMRQFTSLRAVAMDIPSVSSPEHEQAGAEAHRVFLGCTNYAERPVLLVEDALLPDALPELRRVFVMPWLFDGLDSAPCTMFAEVADDA